MADEKRLSRVISAPSAAASQRSFFPLSRIFGRIDSMSRCLNTRPLPDFFRIEYTIMPPA